MPQIRTYLKNKELRDIISLMFLQGVNYIMPVLVLPYLITVIGAEGFGIYSFALSVCQYLILIVDFGFNLSATKQIAIHKGNKEEVSKIFSDTVYAKIFLMLVSFVIAFALSLIPNFAIYREAIFVMFGMVIGHTLLYVFLFQGLDEIRWVSFFTAIAKFMVLPLTFIFVKGPEDLYIAVFLSPPTPTSTPSAASSRCWASPTTGTAKSPPPIPAMCAGPSGFSCASTTPTTTRSSRRPAR